MLESSLSPGGTSVSVAKVMGKLWENSSINSQKVPMFAVGTLSLLGSLGGSLGGRLKQKKNMVF